MVVARFYLASYIPVNAMLRGKFGQLVYVFHLFIPMPFRSRRCLQSSICSVHPSGHPKI